MSPNDTFEKDLDEVLAHIRATLLAKNAAYGDSALNPLRIFSKASVDEQIRVRLDDKLSRLARGHEFGNDDTLLDLLGYVIILLIAVKRSK